MFGRLTSSDEAWAVAENGPRYLNRKRLQKARAFRCERISVDGRHVTLSIDAWTTALDLADALGSELGGVSRQDGLRVFEVSDEAFQERCLDDDERVLDVLAYWDRMQLQDKKKRRKSAHYKLMYKVRYFYTDTLSSPTAEELHYQQARQDILDERYPCSPAGSLYVGRSSCKNNTEIGTSIHYAWCRATYRNTCRPRRVQTGT